jgi:biotin-(acetyl-CoA carboxylase) ligase
VGRFDVGDWVARQLTTGRLVRLEGHGPVAEERLAVGVDPATGALLVADDAAPGGERAVHAGEVTRIRLADLASPADAARPAAAGATRSTSAAGA